MERTLRIGAVNYLNTKPLICDLEELAPRPRLVLLDVPSRLADLLAEGRLDVALIPVIEYFRAGTYTIVPDIAIASRGPVLSVTLFSRVPWPEIRRVALDDGSRTSAALRRCCCGTGTASGRRWCRCRWTQTAEDVDADAVLLIGDRAMRACLPGLRPRLRPGPGVARLDRPAVRLRRLGGARGRGSGTGGRRRLHEAKRRGLARSRADRPPRGAAAGAGRGLLPALPCATSSASTWGRASRPGCTITTCWPASWAWPARGVNLEFYRSQRHLVRKPLTASG